jgi:hypothetical protein
MTPPLDEEQIVYGLLQSNWNNGNVATPPFFYKDDMGTTPRRGVKIYYVDGTCIPIGVSYTGERVTVRISFDFWSSSRDDILKLREEIDRVLTLMRKSTGSVYDWMEHEEGRKLAGYANFYRYVIDVKLHRTLKPQ